MIYTNSDTSLLVAQAGPLNGQRWILRGTLVIGRDISCDIVIADRQVSRQHARITSTPQGAKLEDLGSKNGTHHNGQLVSGEIYLEDGDIIQIALAQKFTYLSSDATVPLEDLEDADLVPMPLPAATLEAAKTTRLRRLHIDQRARRVWINLPRHGAQTPHEGSAIQSIEILPPLSVPQFRLLELLSEAGEGVVTRQDMILAVWGKTEAIGVSEQALDALIRRLRERLAEFDPGHEYILTMRGHGLRLENPFIS